MQRCRAGSLGSARHSGRLSRYPSTACLLSTPHSEQTAGGWLIGGSYPSVPALFQRPTTMRLRCFRAHLSPMTAEGKLKLSHCQQVSRAVRRISAASLRTPSAPRAVLGVDRCPEPRSSPAWPAWLAGLLGAHGLIEPSGPPALGVEMSASNAASSMSVQSMSSASMAVGWHQRANHSPLVSSRHTT